MKVLHLTIKKKWFNLIDAGYKLEEYRELKPFWVKRFIDWSEYPKETPDEHKYISENIVYDIEQGHSPADVLRSYFSKVKEFDQVHLVNGGNFHPIHPNVTLECKGVEIHEGRPEWGAEPGKKYFVIKLGDKI